MQLQVLLRLLLLALFVALIFWIGNFFARAHAFTKSDPADKLYLMVPTPTPAPKVDIVSPTAAFEQVRAIANRSQCAKVNWPDRGVAPAGYIKGSALTFARAYCQRDTSLQKVIAAPVTGSADVLSWYASSLKAGGFPVASEAERRRVVYAMLIGLGMRESSGKYCTGRDASMDFTAADTAESGLMQTSWNAKGFNAELPKLYAAYSLGKRDCQLNTYREGVPQSYCEKPSQVKLWGDKKASGYAFQQLHKSCPAMSVEFAAVVSRFSGGKKSHYGPFRNRAAQVRAECFSMLREVEAYIDANPSACSAF